VPDRRDLCCTRGSALTHHPHVQRDRARRRPCARFGSLGAVQVGVLPLVRVLSRLFRRRFLEELENAHRHGQLKFFGEHVDWPTPMRYRLAHATATVRVVVYASAHSQDPKRCSPTCRATRIGSRSLTRDSLRVTIAASRSVGRLPRTWAYSLQNHDRGDRRVHAPLPAARAAFWLSPHSSLRVARQRLTARHTSPLLASFCISLRLRLALT